MLSLAASALYAIVIAASLVAAFAARARRQRSWHLAAWLGLAVLFAALVLLRVFTVEEFLRGELRAFLVEQEMVNQRRSVQGLFVAAVLLFAAAAAFLGARRAASRLRGRRDRAVGAALAAGVFLTLLVGLRVISLHATDRLLFGPLKLNWIGDLGATFAALAAAVFYTLIVTRRP
ncbi:hypothetical protein [Erythrobacter sp. HL-111]|uniref:hypothetical protein n=1 Tax=Erythrobacter sp. HL-111 TaxID=1798193 RepID=UPI0006DA7F9C|nr:hypothetical protein [Erythrobacter sp. HL-111]KPP94392.1 MAG: Tripartite tricarboxylate transporter TctB family [Erythrobacteraceae bacterium HL-111]SDS54262.1 hypothetical protein SAMN04515621_1759 [Erythrobacter sp. HL-111]